MRCANLTRTTLETDITMTLAIDGTGTVSINTGVGFFDHMLNSFCRFGHFDLEINAEGDLHVDQHHLVEDCGIVLGQAFKEALGDKLGIERVADCLFPMDEALIQAAVDISNRGYLTWHVDCPQGMVGDFPTELAEEFFRAFALNAGITLHIRMLDGKNRHHILEAVFKAVGRVLGLAVAENKRFDGVLSTKGSL
ncbi:imidazoleglycerol-phosphate dehydratase HisB [Dehalobacter sp. DCM]|uniref:imidazoleglycerol-phosphate dehydratase HisB n=1 Tax=Dehalobacter sp. DCM TaxID=2907827 RepID=UPI0030812E94|nr:imidazoleglycerol-phosphate dehydratase HisB [Dehalobacter sp. DCM]